MKKLCAIFALIATAGFAASEITVNWTFSATKGGLALNRNISRQFNISNANPAVSGYTISVTTNAAGTPISAGAVTSNGWGWVMNVQTGTPTNVTSGAYSIDIGTQVSGTFYPVLRLYPNEGFPLRFAPGTTNYARSNSGTNTALILECPIIDN